MYGAMTNKRKPRGTAGAASEAAGARDKRAKASDGTAVAPSAQVRVSHVCHTSVNFGAVLPSFTGKEARGAPEPLEGV